MYSCWNNVHFLFCLLQLIQFILLQTQNSTQENSTANVTSESSLSIVSSARNATPNVLISHASPPQLSYYNSSVSVPRTTPVRVNNLNSVPVLSRVAPDVDATYSNWDTSDIPPQSTPNLLSPTHLLRNLDGLFSVADPNLFSVEDYLSPQQYFDDSVLDEYLFELSQPQASELSSVSPTAHPSILHWPQPSNFNHDRLANSKYT